MTGFHSIDHFVTGFFDIAFSVNLISIKLIFRAVSLRYALSGNCIVVEVELNRFVIPPAVSSIDIWNIALSLSLFL